MDRGRRKLLSAAVALAAVAAGAGALAQGQAQVIRVTARKFSFSPAVIALKRGLPVTLELVAEDVFMGFSAPDFHVRGDIVPRQVTRVSFTPDKVGSFPFLCDVFCGDGHEGMSGKLEVT
jgi:cytochrome c oxidase subunit 2